MTTDVTEANHRRRLFFRIRVAILLSILFVVVLYALRDLRSRRARNDWTEPLDVAIVLVLRDPAPPDPTAVETLRARAAALEDRLAAEHARYREPAMRPFRVHVLGPVTLASPPPPGSGDGALDLARHTLELARWTGDIDARAGLVPDHYDARIYVVARAPRAAERSFVEGESQENGRIGIVDVELDATMADLALFVVTHELMHTLGASDKYDGAGRVRVPEGLAEPTRSPLYPQRFAEVMARNRPIAEGREEIPESLDELAVGPATAREIGWSR